MAREAHAGEGAEDRRRQVGDTPEESSFGTKSTSWEVTKIVPPEFLGLYVVSNAVSLALVLSALKWPRVVRVLFVLIFLGAGGFNAFMALSRPEGYLVYGKWALLPAYRAFISGIFSRYTQPIVFAIALGQVAVAVLLAMKGRPLRLGVAGGIIFLLAIAPLGVGSAFPATLLLALALYLVWRRLPKGRYRRPVFRQVLR